MSLMFKSRTLLPAHPATKTTHCFADGLYISNPQIATQLPVLQPQRTEMLAWVYTNTLYPRVTCAQMLRTITAMPAEVSHDDLAKRVIACCHYLTLPQIKALIDAHEIGRHELYEHGIFMPMLRKKERIFVVRLVRRDGRWMLRLLYLHDPYVWSGSELIVVKPSVLVG